MCTRNACHVTCISCKPRLAGRDRRRLKITRLRHREPRRLDTRTACRNTIASGFKDVEAAATLWRSGRGEGGSGEINETLLPQEHRDGRLPSAMGSLKTAVLSCSHYLGLFGAGCVRVSFILAVGGPKNH